MNKTMILIAVGILCVFAAHAQPNNAFFDFCKTASASGADQRAYQGANGWLFYKPELEHLARKTFWGDAARSASAVKNPAWADPLPAILDFNEQLKKRGIELVFVPVPAKAIVYPDKLHKSFSGDAAHRLDYYHLEFYRLLRAKGVNVVDLLPLFLAHRDDAGGSLYCTTDTHWSGPACELAAQALAKDVKSKAWYRDAPKLDLAAERKSVSVKGDLAAGAYAGAGEKVSLRFIRRKADGSIVPSGDSSPVVLLGDSHTLIFHSGGDMFAEGAGLADQLAYELGFAIDLIGVRGSGATAARVNLYRKAKGDPKYLSGKKLVIWCVTVRDFTESTDGWKLVPVSPDSR